MRTHSSLLFPLAWALLLPGCGARLTPHVDQALKTDALTLRVEWVEPHDDFFAFQLEATNHGGQPLLVFWKDMGCARGGTPGDLHYAALGIGERAIDVAGGQRKSLMPMVCQVEASTGDFHVRVGHVYDNPNADGATPGEVLARDLHLHLDATGRLISR